MTLKSGRQRDHFFGILDRHSPQLRERYTRLYGDDRWGAPARAYHDLIQNRFVGTARRLRIPARMPPHLYSDLLDPTDRVVVILDHLDYLVSMCGRPSPYGRAAHQITRLNEPVTAFRGRLTTISGVGRVTERIIEEILETGRSAYYESLVY